MTPDEKKMKKVTVDETKLVDTSYNNNNDNKATTTTSSTPQKYPDAAEVAEAVREVNRKEGGEQAASVADVKESKPSSKNLKSTTTLSNMKATKDRVGEMDIDDEALRRERLKNRHHEFIEQSAHFCSMSTNTSDYDDTDDEGTNSEDDEDGSYDSMLQPSGSTSTNNRRSLTRGMASKESAMLCLSRARFLSMMTFLALVLCFVIRSTTIRHDYERFLEEFEDFATIIASSIQTNWNRGIAELDGLAVSVTTYSTTNVPLESDNNNNNNPSLAWPFVVIPEFDIRLASVRSMMNAMHVSFVPIVSNTQRNQWESFSTETVENWLFYALQHELNGFNYTVEAMIRDQAKRRRQRQLTTGNRSPKDPRRRDEETVVSNSTTTSMTSNLSTFWDTYGSTTGTPINVTPMFRVSTTLYEMDGVHKIVAGSNDGTTQKQYYPIWQSTPAVAELINFNLGSHADFGMEVQQAVKTKKALLGRIADIDDSTDAFQILLSNTFQFNSEGEYYVVNNDDNNLDNASNTTDNDGSNSTNPNTEPVGTIMFPVFDRFHPPKEVIGVLTSVIRWSEFFRSAHSNLPSAARNIVCVVNNECGQVFSFQVSSSNELDKSKNEVDDVLDRTSKLQDTVQYLGEGDLHDEKFDGDGVHLPLPLLLTDYSEKTFSGVELNGDYCPYNIHVYPSEDTRDVFVSNFGTLTAIFVLAFYAATIFVFSYYDSYVERRQKALVAKAEASNNIVTSLFPEVVRDRLFESANAEPSLGGAGKIAPLVAAKVKNPKDALNAIENEKLRLKNFLTSDHPTNVMQPIADLFTDCTVLFADIAGFTAWSSVREPVQVFTLLETLYAAFDKLATKRRVFKVETIGDCYMAVTGLPDPQPDHAILMARFARGILLKTQILTRQLEVVLGPDTTDLAMRIGLHSGPVTAGVLRGQKSRFQLFGDTVNTASRMESTGRPEFIQCSEQTADLLRTVGKANWLRQRADLVKAKGKGEVRTFWIAPKVAAGTIVSELDTSTMGNSAEGDGRISNPLIRKSLHSLELAFPASPRTSAIGANRKRTIHWNVDLMSQIIKKIVAARTSSEMAKKEANEELKAQSAHSLLDRSKHSGLGLAVLNLSRHGGVDLSGRSKHSVIDLGEEKVQEEEMATEGGKTSAKVSEDEKADPHPRDEYSEAIPMPKFDPNTASQQVKPEEIFLTEAVEAQLRDFVATIALAYRDNPFHNFDHASHVAMSVNKILKRIIQADDFDRRRSLYSNIDDIASDLHNYTYGLTSDPLTHFACVFSAMIHDVDHPGVSNQQLIKENDDMAKLYDGRSVAEQNSFDFSWDLFMDPVYADLRNAIFATEAELTRFRKLVINSVMATDVFDPELVKLRNQRWEKAFAPDAGDSEDAKNLRATIVIEHIIQASDVAHTMQHWHVYQKWNAKLFDEMHAAYVSGRLEKDPSESWYKGELWFYDNYIIPLAKKLKQCGVFGVASDEFLTYAMDNRSEWEMKGEEIVQQLKAKVESQNTIDESSISSNSSSESDDDDEGDGALKFCEDLQQAYKEQLKMK